MSIESSDKEVDHPARFSPLDQRKNKTMEFYPKHLLKIQVLRNKQYSPLMKQILKQLVCAMLIESSVEIQEMVIFKALVDRFS